MKSDDDGTFDDEPTGQFPVASSSDPRVTITGAEMAVGHRRGRARWSTPTRCCRTGPTRPRARCPSSWRARARKDDDPWSAVPAPAWREGEADWVAHEDQFDASILAGEPRSRTTRDPGSSSSGTRATQVVEDETTNRSPKRLVPSPCADSARATASRQIPLAGRAVRQTLEQRLARDRDRASCSPSSSLASFSPVRSR